MLKPSRVSYVTCIPDRTFVRGSFRTSEPVLGPDDVQSLFSKSEYKYRTVSGQPDTILIPLLSRYRLAVFQNACIRERWPWEQEKFWPVWTSRLSAKLFRVKSFKLFKRLVLVSACSLCFCWLIIEPIGVEQNRPQRGPIFCGTYYYPSRILKIL